MSAKTDGIEPGDIFLDRKGYPGTCGSFEPMVYLVCSHEGKEWAGQKLWECCSFYWPFYRSMLGGKGFAKDKQFTAKSLEAMVKLGNLWNHLEPLVESELGVDANDVKPTTPPASETAA